MAGQRARSVFMPQQLALLQCEIRFGTSMMLSKYLNILVLLWLGSIKCCRGLPHTHCLSCACLVAASRLYRRGKQVLNFAFGFSPVWNVSVWFPWHRIHFECDLGTACAYYSYVCSDATTDGDRSNDVIGTSFQLRDFMSEC